MINLNKYDQHEILYPHTLAEDYCIPLSAVYEELEHHTDSDDNLLVRMLELKCPYCNTYTGKRYYSVWDLPRAFCCPVCHAYIRNCKDVELSAVVVYQKI